MSFDHVVVGAGSAGAVMAARLSEDPGVRVLLLEAGPDRTTAATEPGVAGPSFMAALLEPGRMWPELTAVHAAGQEPAPYLRGRGAGGSSAVNAMVVLRGVPADYDRWATDLGCAGWDAPELERLFARAEEALPLEVTPAEAWAPLDRGLREAALALGYPDCLDHNAMGALGTGGAALNIRDGRRVSATDAWLEAARERPNLTVRGDAQVDRVLLDGARAGGVRLATGEEIESRSVVLCAGTIHSPAILLRSGVGADGSLPVGENLVEHPMIPVGLVMKDQARLADQRVISSLVRYSSGLAGAGPADMQILPLAVAAPDPALAGVGAICAAAMEVYSRGRVSLRSADPLQEPEIAFRMLSDERDRVRLRDGLERVRRIVAQPAITEIADMALAGEQPLEAVDSDAYLSAAVTNYVHAVGTCRMGAASDPAAVVDPACVVRGHEGLRVVDASVMPDIPRANTHLTTLAIAEGVAERMASAAATAS